MGLFGRFKLLIAALYQLNEKVSSYSFMLVSKILRANCIVTFLRKRIDGKYKYDFFLLKQNGIDIQKFI